MYIPRLPAGPIVASLASMAQASTLKKCKAADQSSLERQRTQRPQCESLFLPQSPLLAPLSCSQRAVVKETGVWSHLTETRTAHTLIYSSLGLQQAQCWSLAALSGMTDMSLWVFKAPLKTGIKLMFWQTNWLDICNSTASIFNYALTKYRAVGTVFDISCLSRLIFRIEISCERKRNSLDNMLPQAFSCGSNWFKVENSSRIEIPCVIGFN